MTPGWWSWRERAAHGLGPWFWPAWYIAPRSSRDRWAAMAALMESDQDSLSSRVELLQEHGVDPFAALRVPAGARAPMPGRGHGRATANPDGD